MFCRQHEYALAWTLLWRMQAPTLAHHDWRSSWFYASQLSQPKAVPDRNWLSLNLHLCVERNLYLHFFHVYITKHVCIRLQDIHTECVRARVICVGVQFIHAYNVSQRRRHAVMLVVAAAMQADVPKYKCTAEALLFNNISREKLKACLGRHRFCPWLCLARTPSRCMTTSAYLSAHISTFNGVTMANCYDNFNKALWIRRRKHTAVQLQFIPCALGAASFCRSQWLAVRLHFLRNRPARPCNPHTQLRHNINVIS